jgi:hypothetical protein
MLSRRSCAALGIILIGLGVFTFVGVWRDALRGHSLPNSSSVLVFCGPILTVAGVAMVAFRYDQLMRPSNTAMGRRMTLLGLALFFFGLAAAAGNYALMVYLAQKGH